MKPLKRKQKKGTKEPQYNRQVHEMATLGPATMGLTTSYFWRHDAKHLLFTLARYKFVAKMMHGLTAVAEVGCGDAFGMRLIADNVTHVHGYDFDPIFTDDARRVNAEVKNVDFFVHDVLQTTLPRRYDGIYALDVIEHIPPRQEGAFMRHLNRSLLNQGMLILGTPNITSQAYASAPSQEGHINCKSHQALRELMGAYFNRALIFSMNDEMVHTGYGPMAHYLFGIGIGPKKR